VLCPQFIGALIEARTIGTVLNAAAPDRRPTPTDAALSVALLDPGLAGFAALANACADPLPVAGYRCGPMFADARAAQLKMADTKHLRIRFSIVFGGGAKTGSISVIVPMAPLDAPGTASRHDGWNAALKTAVLGTSAQLEAILCKLSVPLSELSGFSPGDLLPLSGATVNGVWLIGLDGVPVAGARLGRSGRDRAVRLAVPTHGRAPPAVTLAAPDPAKSNHAATPTQGLAEEKTDQAAADQMSRKSGSQETPRQSDHTTGQETSLPDDPARQKEEPVGS